MKYRLMVLVTITSGIMVFAATGLLFANGPIRRTDNHIYTVCSSEDYLCDYTIIQDALDASSDGDVIKIATGIYSQTNQMWGYEQIAFIDKSVSLIGGYTVDFAEPPIPDINRVVLNARRQGRGLFITGDNVVTIQGLYITQGNAKGSREGQEPKDVGGGIYSISATMVLSDNFVFNNSAQLGGGLYLSNNSNTLRNNTIFSNASTYDGGGIYLDQSSMMMQDNAIFECAAGHEGGGIYTSNSSVEILSNQVSSNTAWAGGGITIISSTAVISANLISGNSVDNLGGGLLVWPGEIPLAHNPMVLNNTIVKNTANLEGGGGLYLDVEFPLLQNNLVADNSGQWYGGGIVLWNSSARLAANTITNNIADFGGGIMILWGSPILDNNSLTGNHLRYVTRNCGSAATVEEATVKFLHTTVADNHGGDGSGICFRSHSTAYPSKGVFTNTILVGHSLAISVSTGSSASLNSTLWDEKRGTIDEQIGGAGAIEHENDFWGDPEFVDPKNKNYHISRQSNAIDHGIDTEITTDIDNESRRNGKPDLGADEYWGSPCFPIIYLPLITGKMPSSTSSQAQRMRVKNIPFTA